MLKRTVRALFWAVVALLALAFIGFLPTAVELVWPALLIATVLWLIVAVLAHLERNHP